MVDEEENAKGSESEEWRTGQAVEHGTHNRKTGWGPGSGGSKMDVSSAATRSHCDGARPHMEVDQHRPPREIGNTASQPALMDVAHKSPEEAATQPN